MRCVLAIDAGGSKCDALLARDDGTVLGYGHVDVNDPAGGRGVMGSGRSYKSIAHAAQQAMGETTCDELILAGFTSTLPPIDFQDNQRVCIHTQKITEQDPAFALTGEPYGIVILAGTGALVYGQISDGRTMKIDGLGPMLGDHGGGFQIGLMALRAVAKSLWHTRHATALTEAIQIALKIDSGPDGIKQMIEFMLETPDRSEIARFARVVDAAAMAGDPIAQTILRQAADDIAESAWDLVDQLGIAQAHLPVIGTGSVITHSSLYWARVSERIREFAPHFRFMRLHDPPILGMVLTVLQQLKCGDQAVVRKQLQTSFKTILRKR
jgi:N-acetylglucosamine kinase-like BadF-type ATPase